MKKDKKTNDSTKPLYYYKPPTAFEAHINYSHETNVCTEEKNPSQCLLVNFDKIQSHIQQVFYKAFQKTKLPYRLYLPDKKYKGEEWYDYLPTLEIEGITIKLNGKSGKPEDFIDQLKNEFLEVDSITINTVIHDKYSNPACEQLDIESDVCFIEGEYFVEDISIFLTKERSLQVDELSEFIVDSFFIGNECDDRYDSEKLDYEDEADRRARFLLLPEDIAVKESIKIIIFQHFSGLLSPGMTVNIKMVSTKEKLLDFEIDLSKK